MSGLITGERVTVKRLIVACDELEEQTVEGVDEEDVENVVVVPGATADLDSTRPNGVSVEYTLCFPKTYEGDLTGAVVAVRGVDYKVVGNPQRYTEANTPGDWNLTAEVTRTDG